MSDLVIRAEGVGKKYHIGMMQAGYRTLRDQLVELATAPARWLRRDNVHPDTILWALKDVSFEIHQGEVMGIIGRNGAGKSTLLKILSRITEPTEGKVRIAGRIGALLEVGTGFHPELTGRENTFLNGAILGMRRSEIERRFDEIVAFSEVEKFIDTPVKHYSSGMFLRLAFAVAAHLNPDILLVDEVLAVGDVRFQQKCLGKMESVSREGRTVVFISHNMPAVTRLCPRAILLDEGKVVMDGPTRDVISRYLGADREISGTISWASPEEAPGDDVARLRSVRVMRADGETCGLFTMREPIQLEITFWLLQDLYRAVPMIMVYNESGLCVFTTQAGHDPEYRRQTRTVGVYTSVVEIPGDLMNEGTYTLDVSVRTMFPRRYFLREGGLVSFRVQDNGLGDSVRGEYMGAWSGALAPKLNWRTTIEAGRLV
jgi:lipopolysaccharide transport system ATP-binding protein